MTEGEQKHNLARPASLETKTKAGLFAYTSGNKHLALGLPDDRFSMTLKAGSIESASWNIRAGIADNEFLRVVHIASPVLKVLSSVITLGAVLRESFSLKPSHFRSGNLKAKLTAGGTTLKSLNILAKPHRLSLEPKHLSASGAMLSGGEHKAGHAREVSGSSRLKTGQAIVMNFNINIMIGDDLLQELILKFEERIFARLDEHIRETNAEIEALSSRISALEKLIEPEG